MRWLAYANHTNFITQDKTALGYTGLFEIGTGLEWQLNVKPLDWTGLAGSTLDLVWAL